LGAGVGWWEDSVEGNYQKGLGQASHSNEYYSTEPVSLQAMWRMRTITVLIAGGAILGAAAAGLFSGGGGAAAGGAVATSGGGGSVLNETRMYKKEWESEKFGSVSKKFTASESNDPCMLTPNPKNYFPFKSSACSKEGRPI
jgi:hypothetical protein